MRVALRTCDSNHRPTKGPIDCVREQVEVQASKALATPNRQAEQLAEPVSVYTYSTWPWMEIEMYTAMTHVRWLAACIQVYACVGRQQRIGHVLSPVSRSAPHVRGDQGAGGM